MNEFELQQLMQQMQNQNSPQLQQGLLGDIGQNNNQDAQNLLGQGQQSAQMMAQQGEAGNQAAMQQAEAGNRAAAMASQQAMAQQQQKKQQAMGMLMSFLPVGQWLGAAGKALGIGGK